MCPCVIFIGVSVWRCVLLQNAMIKLFILLCVSVCHFHWCVRVAVCPALKCYDIIIPITLCVRVAVCPSSKCYDIIIHNTLCHFHWCVRVAVCPASKCYYIIIHIILCVRVSFLLVCLCGSVSCFKMI